MNTLLETARFSRVYLARYWFRFVAGLILGILFGVSNGLAVGSIYVFVHRLADPAQVQQVVEKGLAAKAAKKNGAESPALHSLKDKGVTFKEEFYLLIDPWLPLKGRALDWKQCLGGYFFIPIAFALRGLLGYGSSYLLAWSGQRITNDVKVDAFRKVSSLSLDFFQKTTTSELIARIESDGTALNTFLKLGLSDLIKEPSTILCIFIAMLKINWKFTLISLIFTPFCAIPTRLVAKKVIELGRRDFSTNVGQGSITIESFQNVRITKAYGLEEAHAQAFFKLGQRSASLNMKSVQNREILNPIVQTLSSMGISAVLLYAVWTNCDFDTITTFIAALVVFSGSVKKLNGIGVYFTQLSVALERLMALFKLRPSVREAEHPVAMSAFTRAIEFRHVSFSYGEGPVLDDVSFTLLRGRRLGLLVLVSLSHGQASLSNGDANPDKAFFNRYPVID